MQLNRFVVMAAVVSSLSVTGCVNISTATVDPSTNVYSLKTMYVQQSSTDQRGVANLIADKLRTKGVQVSVGAAEQPKAKVDALVTYKDVWIWDWSTYLLDLTILMKNPTTEQILASGNSRHGTLTRLTPTEMVSEVVDKIYSSSGGSGVIEPITTPATATQAQPKSSAQKLQDLKALLDQGVITKSEYDQQKKTLLKQL